MASAKQRRLRPWLQRQSNMEVVWTKEAHLAPGYQIPVEGLQAAVEGDEAVVRAQAGEGHLQQGHARRVHVEAIRVVQAPEDWGEGGCHRDGGRSRGGGGHDVLLRRGVAGVQKELVGHVVDANAQVSCCAQIYQLHPPALSLAGLSRPTSPPCALACSCAGISVAHGNAERAAAIS